MLSVDTVLSCLTSVKTALHSASFGKPLSPLVSSVCREYMFCNAFYYYLYFECAMLIMFGIRGMCVVWDALC